MAGTMYIRSRASAVGSDLDHPYLVRYESGHSSVRYHVVSTLSPLGRSGRRAGCSADVVHDWDELVLPPFITHIIATDFPELQDFIDMLYQDDVETLVQKDDSPQKSIPLREGFSQVCPASPLFAALVLNYPAQGQ